MHVWDLAMYHNPMPFDRVLLLESVFALWRFDREDHSCLASSLFFVIMIAKAVL